MDRRRFIGTLAGSLLAAPLAAEAQQAGEVHEIGIVWGTFPDASKVLFEPLREALRELGYVEGRNILFQQRWAEGRPDQFPELMDSLIRLKVEVIVGPVNPIIAAARQATKTIPIVMLFAVDPVGAGFVASLAKPGGNVTGLSIGQEPETLAKNRAVEGCQSALVDRCSSFQPHVNGFREIPASHRRCRQAARYRDTAPESSDDR